MTTFDPDYDPSHPAEAAEPTADDAQAGMSDAQRQAVDHALKMRREGGSRRSSVEILGNAGYEGAPAEVMIDQFDELLGIMHGVRPDDVSAKVAARLDEVDAKGAPAERGSQLTKSAEVLMKEATAMSAKGRPKNEVAKYLTEHGASKAEADKAASQISMDISTARGHFNESKQKAMNSAYWKIGLGILITIVGLVLMGSGAESSGRRTPLGAVIGGVVMLGSGIMEISKVQSQSFSQRVSEVYR